MQGNVAGLVRLATSDNLVTHFILPSLKGLLEKYPDLRVEVLSGIQSANLHRRDADIAIRMIKPDAGNLTLKRLGTVGFGLYGAKTYLENLNSTSADLSLSHAQYVEWSETHQHLPAARWVTRMLRGRPCRVEANTLMAQISAVSEGLGLGGLPHFMAKKNGLRCVNPDIGVEQPLWLVMHSDLAGLRRVRAIADHLITVFDGYKNQLTMP